MLYYYIGLGALILGSALIFSSKYLAREKRYKQKLNHFLQNSDFSSAIEFAKKLTVIYKGNPDYYFLLADIYQKAKMTTSAVETYKYMLGEKIFSPKINEHNVRGKLAIIKLNEGKIIEAFRELYMISKLSPNDSFALGALGRIYGSQHNYETAIELLKKAISLEMGNSEFHYQLGLAYLDSNNLDSGLQELDKAVQFNPGFLKAQYFLALAARQKGLKEKAARLFKKLNLKDTSNLPPNILRIGIMTQNMPIFKIDVEEKNLDEKSGNIYSRTKDYEKITLIEDLLHADPDLFHSTIINIINKLGYIIEKEVKTKLSDSSSETNFIAVLRKDKGNPDAGKYFIQFTKSTSEIQIIPYTDFLSKMQELNLKNGVFIITSTFSSQILEKAKNEKENIILIDEIKLRKYF